MALRLVLLRSSLYGDLAQRLMRYPALLGVDPQALQPHVRTESVCAVVEHGSPVAQSLPVTHTPVLHMQYVTFCPNKPSLRIDNTLSGNMLW